MITTRRTGSMFRAEVQADPRFRAGYGLGQLFRAEAAADPRVRAGYALGAGRMSYGYGDYGDVVNVRGRRRGLGEVIRWAPLGPGGDPQMSLQGRRRGLGEVIRWAPLGPGGDPQMSLQGFPMTMAEVDWTQIALGAAIGIGAYMVARKQNWVK